MPQNRAIYGQPFFTLPDQTNNQLQISPRVPGAIMLENITAKSLDSIIIHAPENTLERQYVLARSLFSVKPYGSILAFASNTKGGARLATEFAKFGCIVEVNHQSHYKISEYYPPSCFFPLATKDEKTLRFIIRCSRKTCITCPFCAQEIILSRQNFRELA